MRTAIIGGGAAGFFGAISAATHSPETEVVIFEATRKPLEKVRISGGGRCNVTHHCFESAELIKRYPRGGKELRGPLNRFGPSDTIAWFETRGVRLKTESDGRMFPTTDDSATIANCLYQAVKDYRIELRLGARIKSIRSISERSDEPQFELTLSDGSAERFDRVLLATGSSPPGYRFAEALGHSIVECVPSLFTFKINDPRLKDLSGITFPDVQISLIADDKRTITQGGPLLITHWGLSGPAALKLSAWGARELHACNYKARIVINFCPELTSDQLYNKLNSYKEQHSKKLIINTVPLDIPKNYWRRIVTLSGIAETTWSNITKSALQKLVTELSAATFKISGKGIFKEEFVTAGGVDLREVDFRTMESKITPGLFFAGELLDIDGVTGGFNFQNAWTTGWIAGTSISAQSAG